MSNSGGRAAGLRPASSATACKHVISLVFDNVHFFRDNPNVPSDLEQMPHLLNFLEANGTVLSNMHTPLIAHTADDSLTIYTGLYGDRHGQPVTQLVQDLQPGRDDRPGDVVRLLDAPGRRHGEPADRRPRHDADAWSYSADRAGDAGATDQQTPAPWVPFTRAGCTVGDFSTANMVLENTGVDIPTVFGPSSPEVAQLTADPDSFKDAEVADYIGVAVHCAQGDADLRERTGGEVRADHAVAQRGRRQPADRARRLHRLPGPVRRAVRRAATRGGHAEPDAQRLPGHQRGRATSSTSTATQINEPFLTNHPGFPGFSPTAIAVAGLPRRHAGGRHPGHLRLHLRPARAQGRHQRLHDGRRATAAGKPLGPGDTLLRQQRQGLRRRVRRRSSTRLAADGITPANTDVRDQRRGERPVRRRERRAGRPSRPRPAATA